MSRTVEQFFMSNGGQFVLVHSFKHMDGTIQGEADCARALESDRTGTMHTLCWEMLPACEMAVGRDMDTE